MDGDCTAALDKPVHVLLYFHQYFLDVLNLFCNNLSILLESFLELRPIFVCRFVFICILFSSCSPQYSFEIMFSRPLIILVILSSGSSAGPCVLLSLLPALWWTYYCSSDPIRSAEQKGRIHTAFVRSFQGGFDFILVWHRVQVVVCSRSCSAAQFPLRGWSGKRSWASSNVQGRTAQVQ